MKLGVDMPRHQKNIVHLTVNERSFLQKQIKSGQWRPREVQRARILLLADINGPHSLQDFEISEKLGCSLITVTYRRKRFAKNTKY
jgi:hypothetical protein